MFPDGPHYDIQYDQLLNYARIISRTTIPPAAAVAALQAQNELQANIEISGLETAATTPGVVGTPAATPNGIQSVPGGATPAATAQTAHPLDPSAQDSARDAEKHLPGHIVDHIRSTVQTQFVPWPNEDNVRQGCLASMAILMEKGIDPEDYDPEAEKLRKEREEQERREAEERERIEREERERRLREEQARQRAELARQREKESAEGWRRQSVSTGGNPPASSPVGEKKQFMFTSLDDDDDDDD